MKIQEKKETNLHRKINEEYRHTNSETYNVIEVAERSFSFGPGSLREPPVVAFDSVAGLC